MISTLFRKKKKAAVGAPINPHVPDGAIVWAIGDVHGRLDLLKPLVEAIMADAAASEADRKIVIFLGDFIDRGPESRGVLRYLDDLSTHRGLEWRFLLGNHEQTMLDFLADPNVGVQWCDYGGDATLASFGLSPPDLKHRAEGWARLVADLDHKVTPAERRFLHGLELSITIGDYFFAHAGARPGQALDRQSTGDLLWIRRSFLDDERPFERIVVHGHTPSSEVHSDHRRIGIDTKAYQSGVLTALRLEGASRSLVQAIGPPDLGQILAHPSDIDIVRSLVA